MDIFEQVAEMRHQEGVEEAKREVVENLLKDPDFSLDKIASIVNAPLDFVKEVKKGLRKK